MWYFEMIVVEWNALLNTTPVMNQNNTDEEDLERLCINSIAYYPTLFILEHFVDILILWLKEHLIRNCLFLSYCLAWHFLMPDCSPLTQTAQLPTIHVHWDASSVSHIKVICYYTFWIIFFRIFYLSQWFYFTLRLWSQNFRNFFTFLFLLSNF